MGRCPRSNFLLAISVFPAWVYSSSRLIRVMYCRRFDKGLPGWIMILSQPSDEDERRCTMNKHTIWYTRCPTPTASGIAFQRHSFGELFVGTEYEVRNIQELGREHANVHF